MKFSGESLEAKKKQKNALERKHGGKQSEECLPERFPEIGALWGEKEHGKNLAKHAKKAHLKQ